jgi:NAD(P)H-dependent FMN reductase
VIVSTCCRHRSWEEAGLNSPKIGVILGSTRTGRRGAVVADWVLERARDRAADYELIDLVEHPLPFIEEPIPPMAGRYSNASTLEWASVIAPYDGFIIVTPEYNHGIPGVLKNALDHLYAEWTGKAVGFVGYGLVGGARAMDQLRVLSGVLGMADVGVQVELSIPGHFDDQGVLRDGPHVDALSSVFDRVEAWTEALSPLRTPAVAHER